MYSGEVPPTENRAPKFAEEHREVISKKKKSVASVISVAKKIHVLLQRPTRSSPPSKPNPERLNPSRIGTGEREAGDSRSISWLPPPVQTREDAILREAHEKYEKITRNQELFYAALSREKFVWDLISREENAREEVIEQGMINDKQIILKKLLTRKFQPSDDLLQPVDHCSDPGILDKTLNEILTGVTADEIMELLQ